MKLMHAGPSCAFIQMPNANEASSMHPKMPMVKGPCYAAESQGQVLMCPERVLEYVEQLI
jgi:hypothetical protein